MARALRRHASHPTLSRPVPHEQVEAELYEFWVRSGLPGGYLLAWGGPVDLAHERSSRRYAQVLIGEPPRFEFANAMTWLPGPNRTALLAHEVGHVLRPGSEQDADDAAEDVLGVRISYDMRWPGKGLQTTLAPRENPTRSRSATTKVRRAMRQLGVERGCYPAAEVVYHAGGGKGAGLTPMQLEHEGWSHWYVEGPEGQVYDPSAYQFDGRPDYDGARGRGFQTRRPSKRARALARAAQIRLNPWRENRVRRSITEAQQSLFRGGQLGHRFGMSKVLTVGEGKRGEDRVWLEGNWLQDLGYDIGKLYDVSYDPRTRVVRLALSPGSGKRKVSKHKRGKRLLPVIDLTNRAVTETLLGAESVVIETKAGEIIIRPASVPRMIADRKVNGLEGSIFTGAGFLSEAAAVAGYEPVWGVEIETRNAAVYGANHPRAIPLALPVQEAALLNYQMATLGSPILEQVELLTGGIPCQPFSKGWTGKWIDMKTGKVLSKKEVEKARTGEARPREARDHDLISMTHWFLSIVQQTNPLNILIEEVEFYFQSESFAVLRDALEIMGYRVQWAVIDSNAMGSLAGRRRAVVVATTSREFDLYAALVPEAPTQRAGDVLLPAGEIDRRMASGWWTEPVDPDGGLRNSPLWKHPRAQGAWFSLDDPAGKGGRSFGPGAMLRTAWKRKGFKPNIITADTPRVGAIKKTYHKVQPENPYVAHPANRGTPSKPAPGDRYRMLLVEEVKRLHGVPEDYTLPERYSDAIEVLGQGVVVDAFAKLISRLPRNKAGARPNPPLEADPYFHGAW